jgi:hypothetical protein
MFGLEQPRSPPAPQAARVAAASPDAHPDLERIDFFDFRRISADEKLPRLRSRWPNRGVPEPGALENVADFGLEGAAMKV